MNISFNYRNIKFRIKRSEKHKIWISGIIRGEGRVPDAIDFVFTCDDTVKGINKEFLGHDYYTDVIAFDYCEGKRVKGEVYISVERVRVNAGKFGVKFDDEIRRVISHAVLHLCGYDDASDDEAERMKEREDFWLIRWTDGDGL